MKDIRTGTCVRNAKGECISAVSWIEGTEVWVQITTVEPNGTAKSLVLPGGMALVFAHDLKDIVPNAEVCS